ncbi:MAG TPA: NAD(+)/NADH kinase [Anaerolineaceae bacterium]|jgi:NAD+ kinase|nr:NAD(+)/NADH kinase [Chloroflexota bacterium]HNS07979.1 NAD(+)/NADH kinase [Anaerolineaceae bacterium]HOE01844.1 NAD(+)/NADH kinase [Anaerolineaceae bacterium]HOQ69871.1 NAD(+)/NADH kinase [Anaerolineaceae bacterium]HOS54193.1 NAD(+)/NADH kinase [Anaerolineaceae bacterium]
MRPIKLRYNKETMSTPSVHRIAIVVRPGSTDTLSEGAVIQQWLKSHGVSSTVTTTDNQHLRRKISQGEYDLLIALGGDGTMLRAGHLAAPQGLPILGINLGKFGFLMQLSREDWADTLPRLLAGDYKVENRMMLQAQQWRGDERLRTSQVINEVVVARGQVVRPIRIHAEVDGYPLASYVADGLIASTPTGSTAYALAVGGPIMPPELRNILIMPVAPHLSMDRAVILPEGASVVITVDSDHEAVMSVDGHEPALISNQDRVTVTASDLSVKFVVFQEPGYFYRNLSNYMEQNPSIGDF